MKVKINAGGVAKRSGTLTFADLEQLPRTSHVFLLQCGSANPRGVVKWTGVRFADLAGMLGVLPSAAYCRFVAADRYWADEEGGEGQRACVKVSRPACPAAAPGVPAPSAPPA
jgi:DMSO/TMAO reductase YedYZ molybdopterin-dependent catalytic subunit